jgi:hypothetical protein
VGVSEQQAYPTAAALSCCYDRLVWTAAEISLVIDDEASAGSIVTVRVSTPMGQLEIMANIESFGRELVLSGVHIQTETLRANALGWPRLRQIARVVAEMADVEVVVVKNRSEKMLNRWSRL